MEEIFIIINQSIQNKNVKGNFDVENKKYTIITNNLDDDLGLFNYYLEKALIKTENKESPVTIILNSFTIQLIKSSKIFFLITFNIEFLLKVYYSSYKQFFDFLKKFKMIYYKNEKKIDIKTDFNEFPDDDSYLIFIIILCYLSNEDPIISSNMYINEFGEETKELFKKANLLTFRTSNQIISLFSNEKIMNEIFNFFPEIFDTNLFKISRDYLVFKRITTNKLIINSTYSELFLEICLSKNYLNKVNNLIKIFSQFEKNNLKIILHTNEFKYEILNLLSQKEIFFLIVNEPYDLYTIFINIEKKFLWIILNINKSNIELINIIKEINSKFILEKVLFYFIFDYKIIKIEIFPILSQTKIYKIKQKITEKKQLIEQNILRYLDNNNYDILIGDCVNSFYLCYIISKKFSSLRELLLIFYQNHNLTYSINSICSFQKPKLFIKTTSSPVPFVSQIIHIKSTKRADYQNLLELINKDCIEFPCRELHIGDNTQQNNIVQMVKYKRNFTRLFPLFIAIKTKMRNLYKKSILLNITRFLTLKTIIFISNT